MDATPIVVTIVSVGAATLVTFVGAAFRLGAMLGKIQEQVETLPQLRHDVRELSGRVDGLTGRVDELTGRVNELTGRVNELTGRVNELTGRVDGLTQRVDGLTDRVSRVEGVIDGVLGGRPQPSP